MPLSWSAQAFWGRLADVWKIAGAGEGNRTLVCSYFLHMERRSRAGGTVRVKPTVLLY
ncbi:hypothetical protein HYPGJ_30804 [Hyphomicrobium sp. GJ21]|nr:hypothetical protein HYPGJ_30804 [Hyphomicrobium sp. GJ21]